MLTIKDLTKYYKTPMGSVQALRKVNLEIPRGEIVGLFGENGAGKSSIFKCILNYVRYEGNIRLDGERINSRNIEKLSLATCDHSFFANLTPESHRSFYEMHFPRFREDRFRALMDFFELPNHTVIRNFSTGQKNQFEVIMALSQGADYIFMDEPFAGNDIFNREDFYKVLLGILEPQETIILSTHLIEEVEAFVGRALLLRKGELIGDVNTLELEEQGESLVEYIKNSYGYRSDRVGKALKNLQD